MLMDAGKSTKGAEESSQTNKIKNVMKSKRRRFQDDGDDGTSHVDNDVKELLANELSNYLDRTIEEVIMCERDGKENNMEEGESDDFRLFSNSKKTASGMLSEEMQDDAKASSSSSDDEETTARFKEAAISVEDIFGP